GGARILYIIPISQAQDTGMPFFNGIVAEQPQIASFGPADGSFFLDKDHFPARTKARLHANPGYLEDDLGQADQETDAQAENDEAPAARAYQGILVLAAEDMGPEQAEQPRQQPAQQ